MTTGTNLDVPAAARRWAAGLLGVEKNATSAEARRAYFWKLREHDFLAPRSLHQALGVFEGRQAPSQSDEEWLLEEEGRLRAEVESFAAEFFTLAVPERRERWHLLLSRCESFPPLTARLQGLIAGLDVDIQSLLIGPTCHRQLAERLLQSFPLPPLAQAESRQAFLRRIEQPSAARDRRAWEQAARYVLAEWPALAALDPEMVQHVAKLRGRLKRRNKMHRRSEKQRRAALARSKKQSPWWLLFYAALVLGGIVSGVLKLDKPSLPPAPPVNFDAVLERSGIRERSEIRGPASAKLRMVADPKTQELSLQVAPDDLPPIPDLLDPSRHDVALDTPIGGHRVLRFTPRQDSTIPGTAPQASNDPPLLVGEAYLRILGVSQEQINVLFSRAEAGKGPDIPLKPAQSAKARMVANPKTGEVSLQVVPEDVPPIKELLDPSRYEVEIDNPIATLRFNRFDVDFDKPNPTLRVLRFTPRQGSTITGRGPQANNGQPLLIGEGYLKLMGVSQERINAWFSKAAVGKGPGSTTKTPPAAVSPMPPKPAQGGQTRP